MTPSIDDHVFASVGEDLARLVRIPSLSLPGSDPEPLERSARAVARLLGDAGSKDVRIVSADGGRPAVIARWPAPPGKPTALLYAHHDIQPPGPDSAWTTPPFEPAVRDGRLHGRGAADNKAGVVAHAAALRAHGGRPPVGVVVLVEGEEEIGSPTIEPLLTANAAALRADLVAIADSAMLRAGQPAITVSMRGLVDCVVEVSTLEAGVHSGVFGGIAPDAISTLARLLATLHKENGRVAVPGLEDASTDGLALEGAELRRHLSALEGVAVPSDDVAVATHAWSQPALSIVGLDAPSVAGAANQLVARASAKISLRVPPGITADHAARQLERHLLTSAPWGAHICVRRGTSADPFRVDVGHPLFALAEQAFTAAWQEKPIRIGTGGTIPIVGALNNHLPKAPIIMFGAGDRSSRTHAPDESVDLLELRRVALAEALLLVELDRSA